MRLAAARRCGMPVATTRSPSYSPAPSRAEGGRIRRSNLPKIHSFHLFPLEDSTQKPMPDQAGVLINIAAEGPDVSTSLRPPPAGYPSETKRFGLSSSGIFWVDPKWSRPVSTSQRSSLPPSVVHPFARRYWTEFLSSGYGPANVEDG